MNEPEPLGLEIPALRFIDDLSKPLRRVNEVEPPAGLKEGGSNGKQLDKIQLRLLPGDAPRPPRAPPARLLSYVRRIRHNRVKAAKPSSAISHVSLEKLDVPAPVEVPV